MFGLTGDLGDKKLFPALVELAVAGLLDDVPVVAVGRRDVSNDDLTERLLSAASDISEDAGEIDPDAIVERVELHYVRGDSNEASTFSAIADVVGEATTPVVYAALPPSLFAEMAGGFVDSSFGESGRLVLEKPFGDGAEHAQRLHDSITERIPAERLFIVDHFLAKGSIENLVAVRTANPMLDGSMRSECVERVEVVVTETFDVEGRGGFYDPVGATRDVLQNHLLETLAVLAMEPPADTSSSSYDDARSRLLASIEPIEAADVVLGQYDGYRKHDDVDDDSDTETFVAARLHVDTDRWRGVPFFVKTGKALEATRTEAIVVFADGDAANRLRFRLKPDTTVEFEFATLDADADELITSRLCAVAPDEQSGLGDYAAMLAAAMAGDSRPFAKIDDIVEAWKVVEPILDPDSRPAVYERGSTGPPGADELIAPAAWTPPVGS